MRREIMNLDFREKDTGKGVLFKIRVKPNKNVFRVVKGDKEYIVEVSEPAQKNKANRLMLREFKKIFKTNVDILYGEKSHTKVLFVEGISLEDFHKLISHLV